MKNEIRNCNGKKLYLVEAENMREAILKLVKKKADLTGADLTGADLTGAILKNANLTGADLRGADLRGAILMGADLTGADLRYAILIGADLRGAILMGADLTGADLTGADLDYCGWIFSCKTLSAIIDDKIRIQLLYHSTKPNGEIVDSDLKELMNSELFKKVVNKFHRVNECGVIQ